MTPPPVILWNRTTSPCCEDMSTIFDGSCRSNETFVTESNSPD